MPINLPASLQELAALFPVPLYVVGGFVRDSLLGYHTEDVDICSSLTPEEVTSLLAPTRFKVKTGSPKLLTLILCAEDRKYEYTTFRSDSYKDGHRPVSVTPCTDITVDARRRDFTVNAIYYDVKNACLVDPLCGIGDLNNRVLRTTRAPEDVFSEDGLRLMRLARFAASLGFTPLPETLEAAKKNASLILNISPERIKDELNKILVCDLTYGVKGAQRVGLEILTKIGVTEKILPELTLGIGMPQRADFHAFDVYGHILSTVEHADPSVRLAALMHDIAKPKMKLTTGRYAGHDREGGVLAREVLSRLRYSNAEIEETARLTEAHMFNLSNDVRVNTLRLFIQTNRDIVDKLVLLKYADYYGSGTATTKDNPSADRIQWEFEKMKQEGVPFSVKDLDVSGDDLAAEKDLPADKRGLCLLALLRECALADSPYLHNRQKQLDYIKNYTRRALWTTK